nr:hypothetical protein [Planctomycetota bacterium]
MKPTYTWLFGKIGAAAALLFAMILGLQVPVLSQDDAAKGGVEEELKKLGEEIDELKEKIKKLKDDKSADS